MPRHTIARKLKVCHLREILCDTDVLRWYQSCQIRRVRGIIRTDSGVLLSRNECFIHRNVVRQHRGIKLIRWVKRVVAVRLELIFHSTERLHDAETVRRFLAPQDRTTQALMSDRISSRYYRAEFTCEWAAERLIDFARSRDDVLLITGKEYSGKSVLAGWIADRMRNTRGRLAHEIISFSIDAGIRDQMSPLAVLQGLVLQVFDRNIGDLSLFRAILSAQSASEAGRPPAEVEDALWAALDKGLSESGKLMILVDGIDQFGEIVSLQFLERLQKICSSHQPIKAVALR